MNLFSVSVNILSNSTPQSRKDTVRSWFQGMSVTVVVKAQQEELVAITTHSEEPQIRATGNGVMWNLQGSSLRNPFNQLAIQFPRVPQSESIAELGSVMSL